MATPEEIIAELSTHPVALLPVRLETRFPPGGDELRIRIYPDQVHVDAHRQALTDGEAAAGQAYWRRRWDGQADAAWLDLTRGLRPARAHWVVTSTTPTNAADLGNPAGPVFADPERGDPGLGAVARLAGLPACWLVVGYQGGQEVLRVHTTPVVSELAISLVDDDAPVPVDGDQPLGRHAAWLADYERAVKAGMAVTVPATAVGGVGLAAGLDLLVVVGVGQAASDDVPSAEVGAASLEGLLAAHVYADGLGLLAAGSPTNDSGTAGPVPSRPVVPDPAVPAPHGSTPPGDRLRADLGLASGGSLDALPVAGADVDANEVGASAIVDALWSSTLGYTLDQLFTPAVGRGDARAARAHARSHLRPAGRYPIMQVGRQPYGVLPVVAPAHLSAPAAPERMTGLLRQVRPAWSTVTDTLPRLAPGAPGADGDVDTTFFEVLRLAPVSSRYRFRTVLGPMLAANTAGLTGAGTLQAQLRQLVFTGLLGSTRQPRLADFVAHPRQWPLRIPLVGATQGRLEPNYLTEIAATIRELDARALLATRRQRSLLEALVALAAVHEIDAAVALIAARHAPVGSPLRRAPWRTPELPGVTAASAPSPRLLADLVLPDIGRPNKRVVAELLAEAEADPDGTGPDRDAIAGLIELLHAVEALAELEAPVLEAALTGFLDACSHRLDAWFTSLAAAQLAAVRADRSEGVHLGAYGWVEDVRPETGPDPGGYLLTPSLSHAVAAAVLRSGYDTHRDEGHEAFDVDVSSARAEQALELLRAVGRGTGLGQVLGYQFERGLHDRGLQRLVQTMRGIAPLHPAPPRITSGFTPPPPDPDPVDGETLLRRRSIVQQRLTGEPASVRAAVGAELDLLADRLDAVGDLATAESVYQLVQGRPERVRAALALVDRQDPAPEPEIGQTPRRGTGFVHRVVVALTDTAPAPGWTGIPRAAHALAEPRLDAWLGRLLGPPDPWTFTGRAVGAGGEVLGTAEVELAQLRLSPLALVRAATAGSAGRPSALEERVARALATVLGEQAAGATLELEPGGTHGLAAFLAHTGAIRALLERSRPDDANAFALPDTVVASGIDAADLAVRADAVAAAFAAAHDQLEAALVAPEPALAAVRDALDAADAAGASGAAPTLELLAPARPTTELAEPAAGPRLLALARSVATAMAGTRARLAALDAAGERLSVLLGAGALVLPTCRLDEGTAAGLRAALDGQAVVTAGDPLATATWFTRLSRVRPAVGALWRALCGAEVTTGGFTPEEVVVAQRPHRDGERWAALPHGASGPPEVDLAMVVVAPGGPDPLAGALAGPLAGGVSVLLVDSWSELVPSADQSCGMAFQYDAPGNRAPQAWLLAVPPDLNAPTWTAEQLLDTVVEAADLTRIRAVTLADLPAAGPVLPAIYLPATLGPEVAGIDLDRWVPSGPMVMGHD